MTITNKLKPQINMRSAKLLIPVGAILLFSISSVLAQTNNVNIQTPGLAVFSGTGPFPANTSGLDGLRMYYKARLASGAPIDTSLTSKLEIGEDSHGTVYTDIYYKINGVAVTSPTRVPGGSFDITDGILPSSVASDGTFYDDVGAQALAKAQLAANSVRATSGTATIVFTSAVVSIENTSQTYRAKLTAHEDIVYPFAGDYSRVVSVTLVPTSSDGGAGYDWQVTARSQTH